MRNLIITAFVICTATLQSMELNKTLTYSIYHGTTICLTKGTVEGYDGTTKYIVFGIHEQQELQESLFANSHLMGTIGQSRKTTVHFKNKDAESASDDDTYELYDANVHYAQKPWQHAHQKAMLSTIILTAEPRIFSKTNTKNDSLYIVRKPNPSTTNSFLTFQHTGLDAIKKAGEDLKCCYLDALKYCCIDTLKGTTPAEKENSIIFPTLSTSFGFPRNNAAQIAVTAVLSFIKKSPDAFNVVHFIVKKNSEFTLYKKLLDAQLPLTTPFDTFLHSKNTQGERFNQLMPH